MSPFFALLSPVVTTKGVDTLSFAERVSPPEDISAHGHLIEWLFNYTTYMNIFFFILVCLGLFGFSFLYASRRHPKAYYTYGNKKVHVIIVTIIGISVFMGVDLNITRISNNDFLSVFANFPDEKKEDDVFRVEVLAQQWMWNFRYPGADGIFNTDDDVTTVNDLRIPVGKKVVFQLLSKDVIHSLYFPNARRKVDAIPGRLTRLWFKPIKTGYFDIACAEMCGTYHYRMQAKLTVYSEAEFETWMNEAQDRAVVSNEVSNPDMYWGWQWSQEDKK